MADIRSNTPAAVNKSTLDFLITYVMYYILIFTFYELRYRSSCGPITIFMFRIDCVSLIK